ncbi:translation initiation factor IF-3 [Afifella sp. IM 167]|nr:translation initiation factor IF-3 [Afifella sp. IM 167]
MRRPHRAPPPVKEGPRVNDEIRLPEIQLIDHEGTNHGIIATDEAKAIAAEAGLDLVEISPNQRPPVCKILDYGKFKYISQKKAAEARKKQKTVDVKEVKMRPNIDTHDYDVKMRNARRFVEDGDKVKMTMRFRGREMAHQELGLEVLFKVRDQLGDISKVEHDPKMEGRQMIMILAPDLKKLAAIEKAKKLADKAAAKASRNQAEAEEAEESEAAEEAEDQVEAEAETDEAEGEPEKAQA